jgi:hypothetical protein
MPPPSFAGAAGAGVGFRAGSGEVFFSVFAAGAAGESSSRDGEKSSGKRPPAAGEVAATGADAAGAGAGVGAGAVGAAAGAGGWILFGVWQPGHLIVLPSKASGAFSLALHLEQ